VLGIRAVSTTPNLSETTSGRTTSSTASRLPHGGHVTLARATRSRLAAFASDVL